MKKFSVIVDNKISYNETRDLSLEFFNNLKNELINPANFAIYLKSSKSSKKFIEKIEKNGLKLDSYLLNNFYEKKL